jgi:hypothetical protein
MMAVITYTACITYYNSTNSEGCAANCFLLKFLDFNYKLNISNVPSINLGWLRLAEQRRLCKISEYWVTIVGIGWHTAAPFFCFLHARQRRSDVGGQPAFPSIHAIWSMLCQRWPDVG